MKASMFYAGNGFKDCKEQIDDAYEYAYQNYYDELADKLKEISNSIPV